ncbi:MAG: hypothetical protein CVT86_05850 [Alphaproteobacteria bacterium HGW-Alphaproteobacteria-8]|nr:MAG: hypothetical protein CVT86_05850 [Alphaproteobacteria bacterium HGW-Alphaproteobacteria-8]
MRFFSSTTKNRIDAKGRVSIPAAFRKVLERESEPGVVLIPRMVGDPAIDCLGMTRFEEMADAIDDMAPLDPVTIALSNKIIGQARQVQIDDTGRIVLPPDLRKTFDLTGEEALFVGLGKTFQIWSPDAYTARQDGYDALAMANFDKLRLRGRGGAGQAGGT